MTKLISQEKFDGLESRLKNSFSENEILAIKSIINVKALYGLHSRMYKPQDIAIMMGHQELEDSLNDAMDTLKFLANQVETVSKEYSKKLGINERKYAELRDFVYTHERKL